MNKGRLYISIFLMVMAIMAVITFQGYWLYKNYQEEKQNLRIQTNILFREAVFQSQAKRLKLDTTIKFRHASTGTVGVVSALQERLRDTLLSQANLRTRVVVNDSIFRFEIDSPDIMRRVPGSPSRERTVIQILKTTEELQDSITTKEIEDQYREMLAKENIDLPFTISRFHGVRRNELSEEANEVTIGFLNPVTFRVNVINTPGYILSKMKPIIIVSFLLVTLTLLSFVLLFRNLMRQRKLTQLKNDFISNITHELKTPIATVSVAIEALKNFNVLSNPERTQEYLNISASELQRLSLLVDKVLRLSMFEKKEIELKKESFDLGHLAKEVMESMKLQFEKQQAGLSIELTGANFIIEADKRHIASVIYNLLDNALKYSNRDPQISLQIIDRSDYIEFRVTDNGIGVPKEYRQKIFEQFFRVPSGDRHNTKGYGLGLSYVNHILRSHQGFIEMESELGKGSTFIVRLPFVEAPVIHYDHNRKIIKKQFKL